MGERICVQMNLSGIAVKDVLGTWNCGKTNASLSDAQLLLLLSGLIGREFHRKIQIFHPRRTLH
jgi:hypothetical protein